MQIVGSTCAKLSIDVASSSLMHRAVLMSLNLSTIQIIRARSVLLKKCEGACQSLSAQANQSPMTACIL